MCCGLDRRAERASTAAKVSFGVLPLFDGQTMVVTVGQVFHPERGLLTTFYLVPQEVEVQMQATRNTLH